MDISTILTQLIDSVVNLVTVLGYPGVFIAMAIEAASVPIPSELIMGLAGFAVSQGKMEFIPVVILGALGNTIGSLATYAYGYFGGRPVIKRFGKYLNFDEEKFTKVESWFGKWGDKIIFFSQMLPFVRSVISLPAGVLKINIIKFEIYTFFGALIWCFLLVGLSSALGQKWEELLHYLDQFETVVIGVIVIAIASYIIYKIYKRRNSSLKDLRSK